MLSWLEKLALLIYFIDILLLLGWLIPAGLLAGFVVTSYGIGITILGGTPEKNKETFLRAERFVNQISALCTVLGLVTFGWQQFTQSDITGPEGFLIFFIIIFLVVSGAVTYIVKRQTKIAKGWFPKIAGWFRLENYVTEKTGEIDNKEGVITKDNEFYVSVFIFNGLTIVGLFATLLTL